MNIVYKNSKVHTVIVQIDWDYNGTDRLHAGTPISATGRIANNGNAIGLLARDTGKTVKPYNAELIVAGVVDLAAVQAGFGSNLTATCKQALDEITFIKADGTVDRTSSGVTADTVDNKITTALESYVSFEELVTMEYDGIYLKSQTPDSTKVFLVTVDDAGTLTATEVTEVAE